MLPFLIAKRRTVAQLKAAIHADDAQISYAATQLSYTRITAPISGRVGARLVDPGNIIQAYDPAGLVVINQIDPITVEFTVPGDSFEATTQAWKKAEKPLPIIASPRHSEPALVAALPTLLKQQN